MGKTCDLGNFEHDMIADAGRVSSSSRGIFLYILKFANFGSINIQLVADLWIKTHKTDESSKGQQQLERKKKGPLQDTQLDELWRKNAAAASDHAVRS